MKKLNLAIIGQGRSGRDIHGAYFKGDTNAYYTVKYVVDKDPLRRERAEAEYAGCKAFADYKELFALKDIDVVVNATYSEMHYAVTKDLLEHGFNVLVEKPFCRNRYEANDLIKTAKENNVILAVFQQTFGAPYYIKAKEILDSGILGKVEQISIRFNNFARRWDWQTLQKKLAGNAYNTGPHPIGIAYGLLDFDKNSKIVYTKAAKSALCAGDAEDYVKILIETPNKPLIDIEINSIDAYCDYNIKMQGGKGSLKATSTKCEIKYLIDGENPERKPIEESLQNENGYPMYCREQLVKHEEAYEFTSTAFDEGTRALYESLYYKLTEGKCLMIEAEDVVMIVGAIEQLHAENPLERKF